MNPSRLMRADTPAENTGTRSGVFVAHSSVGDSPLDQARPASKKGDSSTGAYGKLMSPKSPVPRSGMRNSRLATARREPKSRPYSGHGSVSVEVHSFTSNESEA